MIKYYKRQPGCGTLHEITVEHVKRWQNKSKSKAGNLKQLKTNPQQVQNNLTQYIFCTAGSPSHQARAGQGRKEAYHKNTYFFMYKILVLTHSSPIDSLFSCIIHVLL